ncbi:MAG TPA: hypothetical protein VM600_08345 [Actinomycetota bacterium]|nr:hypothetical protein [Actinomycetota bacterium]
MAVKLAVSFLTGLMMVAMAWAGMGLAPVNAPTGRADLPLDVAGGSSADVEPAPLDSTLQAGAHAIDITPAPNGAKGERWQTQNCATGFVNENTAAQRKTATPDCIYMGGRGLGPSEPITSIDSENPLMVRAVALGDGEDTVVLVQVDGVYWFGRYASFCDACGAYDIIEDLSKELNIDPSGFLIAANHSHNAPDFIGGWGSVPRWYMEQVGESIREAIRSAVASMRPATVEFGEAVARDLNVERRKFYYSAEDPTFTWLRAYDGEKVVATVGAFSAHPVTTGYQGGKAHADWPGAFDQMMRDATGAPGVAFVAGLGNMLTRQGTWQTAEGLAKLVEGRGGGRPVTNPDVASAITFWDQPLTNAGLVGLRHGQFFDRPVDGAPGAITAGKSTAKPCRSASEQTVRTSASAVRIGDELVITGGPGELFSNLTNSVKERSGARTVALPLANVNDGLGYIMQSFETDHLGRQVLGFTPAPVEYEDAFGLDACFGDMVLQTIVAMLREL